MPSELLLAGAQAGGQIVGSAINALSTATQNRKSREWAERMYSRQYEDNLKFWHLQNQYNDPSSQMERYQKAGLNPNLIYGAGSSSAGSAAPISTPDVQQPEFRVPDFGSGISGALGALASYQDFKIKQAQTRILNQQADNLAIDNSIKQFESGIKGQQFSAGEELFATRVTTEKQRLKKLVADTEFTLNQQQLNTIKNTSDVNLALGQLLTMESQRAKTREEVQQIKQATKLLKQDETLKNIQINLQRMGVMPGSPAWINLVGTFFNLLMGRQ